MSLSIGSLPDESDLKISLTSNIPSGMRALIMLVKGDENDNLPFCYQRLASAAGSAVADARQCLRDHVRLLEVVARGGDTTFKLSLAALKEFAPDVTKASILVFVAHTIADLNESDLQPLHATLKVARDVDQATLQLDVTGAVDGRGTADHFDHYWKASCNAQNGEVLLSWQISLSGQDYNFSAHIYGYHGPGLYATTASNIPPGSFMALTMLGGNRKAWSSMIGEPGGITIGPDGQSGSFNAPFQPWPGQYAKVLQVSGTFTCAIPIRERCSSARVS